MDIRIKAEPTEFASAYIQTLPFARKEDEFNSREEFLQYLDERQENYFSHFMSAASYAGKEFQKVMSEVEEDK